MNEPKERKNRPQNSSKLKMEYVKIPPHRFNDVIVHLQNTFFLDEPLNKSVELCTPGCEHGLSEKYSLKTLKDGLSLMAVTPDQEVVRF